MRSLIRKIFFWKLEDIFLDIGANVGIYSIPAAKMCSQVFCVELDPANIYILHSNIYLNNVTDKTVILPFAAGDKKKLEKIYYRDFSIGDALQSVGKEQLLPTVKNNPYPGKLIANRSWISNIWKLISI